MKIKGEAVADTREQIVRLPSGQSVRVRPYPLGAEDVAARLFPHPSPPVEYARRPGSGAMVYDQAGKPVSVPKTDDPEYREAAAQNQARLNAYWFHEAVKHDPDVEFSTPITGKAEDYAALAEELKAARLTMGAIKQVITTAMRMSVVTEEQTEKGRDSFS